MFNLIGFVLTGFAVAFMCYWFGRAVYYLVFFSSPSDRMDWGEK